MVGGLMFVARLVAHKQANDRTKARARATDRANQQARHSPGGSNRSGDDLGNAGRRPSQKGDPESMVCCEHCGLHLPQSEAITTATGIWCSDRHARLGAQR